MNSKSLINEDTHPILFIKKILEIEPQITEFNFSIYIYKKRSREDKRKTFSIQASQVNKMWLDNILCNLSKNEELAFESRIRIGSRTRHIPMLDCSGMSKNQLSAIVSILPEKYRCNPISFYSGRSFHIYYPTLLSKANWVKFMLSALLCNTPGNQVIDQRWIAHRLLAGYGALRWSFNTDTYKEMPFLVENDLLALTKNEKNKLIFQSLHDS
ncbi:hypothetical protein [Aquitalea sp. USM4]|uniref:primase 1D-like protein n=1 Tax=Aquitalea sp. USM4 TaxID=1590041 RepID=UPI0010409A34|nr:hypothetical protein [Aquitalea sp. USM4]